MIPAAIFGLVALIALVALAVDAIDFNAIERENEDYELRAERARLEAEEARSRGLVWCECRCGFTDEKCSGGTCRV